MSVEQVSKQVVVTEVRFEHGDIALGLGVATPRVSWQVSTDDPEWSQAAYELELDGSMVVRVVSGEQVLVPWPFEPLRSRQCVSLRVRVTGDDVGSAPVWSSWSEPAAVEAGLLQHAEWVGQFVTPSTLGGLDDPAPVLSRVFDLARHVRSARLYVTALGVYEARLNGRRVGDEVLAPGWTSYANRLCYQTYDVTPLLREQANELTVLLGNGWFRGGPARIYPPDDHPSKGERLALLAQLEVAFEDGAVQVVGTDERWAAQDSGVLENDLYDGQRTDLRPRRAKDADGVEILDADLERVVAATGPPVRPTEVVPAITTWTTPSGATMVDFGQNLVGWVRLRVRGTVAGTEVVVRHAEVLEHGELSTKSLAGAQATDTYILDEAREVLLEPSLTFHGFRYAEITGSTGLSVEDVQAVVIGSDLHRIGWFECSDPEVNRLHENVVWSARGNLLSVPTDCPQRAERLGWTGDCQVFAPTACFLFDVAGFLDSWLTDLAADQYPDGTVPHVVPEVTSARPATAGWGDAATVVPWVLYQRFGDTGILARQFDSMRAWVDKAASLTTDGVWSGGFQWGDWLDPDAPPENPFAAKTAPDVVATAYLARSASIVADAARVLDKHAMAHDYDALAAQTRDAFAHTYITGAGRISSDSPTAYALALAWDLLPTKRQRDYAAGRLADLTRTNLFRISTGFLGTPVICDALCLSGHPQVAYRLLLERSCPSWLYPVTMGATSIWEHWNALLPDGSLKPARHVSFNHYALGAVADWLHRTVAGLASAAPGYRRIAINPIPSPSLTHAAARHHTPYGEAAVAWRRRDQRFTLDVTVPVGAHATIYLPDHDEPIEVGHGQHTWTTPDPCITTPRHTRPTTVRELLDNPALWNQVTALFTEQFSALDTARMVRRFARQLDDSITAVLPASGDERITRLRTSLDTLLRPHE